MSDDLPGTKSGWCASDGMTTNTLNQTDRSKGNGGYQTGNGSITDPVTGINRISLSSASPSVTFASTSRQR